MVSYRSAAGSNLSARQLAASLDVSAPFSLRNVLSHAVINRAWQHNGGRLGPLGLPTSEVQSVNGGIKQFFQGGEIAIIAQELKVTQTRVSTIRFKGIHCFGTSAGPGADEPYVVCAVYAPHKRERAQVIKIPMSGSYENFSSGTQQADVIDVWHREPPTDVAVACYLMEHDSGDEEEVKNNIKTAVEKGITTVEAAIAAVGGPFSLPEEWISMLTVPMSAGITALLGLGDDVIGFQTLDFKFVELNQLAETPLPPHNFGAISFTHETPLITDGGASYKCYFEVYTEIVDHPLPPG
ncbi:hypothetical protein HTZ77_24550 [Nonomuraea sp. SMC257]|uniref:Uncharacterized protein n=1 Tax=Nonomuraea montanisoli TaxID=2741721 RepID=A0A7Y6IAA7_9ACTN|nr:hypothetical protein [Nonomuraea montanisoli]NUW34582.1 hypothetical protein [Nonomuraea montanisoli]